MILNKNKMNKLLNRTILNTRPLERALPLAKAIEAEGGQCLNLPSFSVNSIPAIFYQEYLKADIWFFMSQYAVKYALPWLLEQKILQKKLPKIAAVGRKTAMLLEQSGIPVTWIPDDFSSEGLLNLPAFYIQKAAFTYNNEPVMNVDFGVGTSEDPYLRFNFVPSAPGVLSVKAVDNDGKEFNHQTEVKN